MKLYQKFLLLTRFKQIALVVISFHFLIVFSLIFGHLISSRPKIKKPIAIRTITPSVPKVMNASPKPIAKSAPNPSKPTVEKPVVQTKKPPSTPTKKSALIKKEPASEPIVVSKPIKPSLTIPAKIETKKETPPILAQEQTNTNPSYGEYLIAYLQNALDLPEYGDVKAKLEIDQFGRLISYEIIDAKSRKNGEFIKKPIARAYLSMFK